MGGWLDMVTSLPETLSEWFQRNDDDMFDRLSHRYTVIQLMLFAVFLSAEQYVGKPISCWSPAHFHDSWEKYTDSYCWVRNTYYLPWDSEIPKSYEERDRTQLQYYQWVPLILVAQAIFFYLPIIMWRGLNQKTGIDVNSIVETSEHYQYDQEIESRNKLRDFLVKMIDRYLGHSKSRKRNAFLGSTNECLKSVLTLCMPCCGKKFGNYMTSMYLITKIVFIANALGQLFFLNSFLGNDYNLYGIHVMRAWMGVTEWTESRRFPRVTLCEMDIRRLGNVQRYTLQCVLTINLFHEMVYLYIWFWLAFISAISIYGLISWLLRIFIPSSKLIYICENLAAHPEKIYKGFDRNDELVQEFVNEYLGQDGVFVLHLVDLNTNKLTLIEILGALWQNFKEKRQKFAPTTDFDDSVDTLPVPRKPKHP